MVRGRIKWAVWEKGWIEYKVSARSSISVRVADREREAERRSVLGCWARWRGKA